MNAADPALVRAVELARDYLDSLPNRPVWPRESYAEAVDRVRRPMPDEPADPETVVDELAAWVEPGLTATPGGRFYGFVIGGAVPAALAADWLTSAWDQNAGLLSVAPAAAAAETIAAEWLLDVLDLPRVSTVGYVTGGTMANYTCLAVARHAVLERVGWDVNRSGLTGAPPIRVVVGGDRHGSVDLAVRYLGLGTDAIVPVASDDQGRIDPDALAAELARGDGPAIVCLQAGEVHTGAFDPFPAAIATAHDAGAWVHVDGAFGLWARAAEETRPLVDGVDGADSWATDAHKTLNVPYDCGIAIVRDREAHLATFGSRAAYLMGSETPEPSDTVPELSRRARGFTVWAALRSLGRRGVADLVLTLRERAAQMADGIRAIPGAEVLNDVVFTQVVVAFGDDETTAEVGRRLLADGSAAVTPSQWRGRAVQRISLSNWSTTKADVDQTVAALGRIAADVRG
ncbi:MAG TPA: aminotransferase class V-fold PLP-dependent enzyme [Nocardioidaceae bacterium]|nr:aminotransferase class V-fold PLP-dependent enzyme [Nocardioidaceae bacterium]